MERPSGKWIWALMLVIRTLAYGVDVPGYASLMVAILFVGGIQLITLGILGEYLGRVYAEVKGRPLYFVREEYGFEQRELSDDRKQYLPRTRGSVWDRVNS